MAAPGDVPSQRSRVRASRCEWQSFCGGGHLQRLSAERCSRALGPRRTPRQPSGAPGDVSLGGARARRAYIQARAGY